MRTKRYFYATEGQSYDLSISDLMSALCCIFVLVTVAITVSLKKQIQIQKSINVQLSEKNSLADKYKELQEELFADLQEDLGPYLERWGATIDPDTLSIRFSSDKGFQKDSSVLNPNYERVLQEFFPKLVRILEADKYKKEIEEIRIEGFTAPNPYDSSPEHDYTSGIVLSQERTQNVLLYCLEQTNYLQEKTTANRELEKDWIRKHIVANGYSLSKPLDNEGKIYTGQGTINRDATRRVEFRIKTNSDKIVQQFQKKD